MTAIHYVVGDERHDVEGPGEGELTVIADAAVFALLRAGTLDPVVAYMQGRIKITGDMAALYDLLPNIHVA